MLLWSNTCRRCLSHLIFPSHHHDHQAGGDDDREVGGGGGGLGCYDGDDGGAEAVAEVSQ